MGNLNRLYKARVLVHFHDHEKDQLQSRHKSESFQFYLKKRDVMKYRHVSEDDVIVLTYDMDDDMQRKNYYRDFEKATWEKLYMLQHRSKQKQNKKMTS